MTSPDLAGLVAVAENRWLDRAESLPEFRE
jgi:hypothetical protein